MTRRDILNQAGPALYGPAWKNDLARALGAYHPDGPREHIDNRLLRRWAAGDRPIPDWILPALLSMLESQHAANDVIRAAIRTNLEAI